MIRKTVLTLGAIALLATTGGCSVVQKPLACGALRDGAFAVASYGCLKIQDAPARDACTKAGLAASLIAYAACTKSGNAIAETGDPPDAAMRAYNADARAILAEYESLKDPKDLPAWAMPGGGTR